MLSRKYNPFLNDDGVADVPDVGWASFAGGDEASESVEERPNTVGTASSDSMEAAGEDVTVDWAAFGALTGAGQDDGADTVSSAITNGHSDEAENVFAKDYDTPETTTEPVTSEHPAQLSSVATADKVERLTEELKSVKLENVTLQADVDSQAQEVTRLRAELEARDTEVAALEAKLADAETANQQATGTQPPADAEAMASLESQVQELQVLLAQMKTEQSQTQQENDNLKASLKDAQARLAGASGATARSRELEEEAKALRYEVEQLKSTLEKERKTHQEQLDRLKRKSSKAGVAKLELELTQSKLEIAKAKKAALKAKKAQAELDEARQTIQLLEAQLATAGAHKAHTKDTSKAPSKATATTTSASSKAHKSSPSQSGQSSPKTQKKSSIRPSTKSTATRSAKSRSPSASPAQSPSLRRKASPGRSGHGRVHTAHATTSSPLTPKGSRSVTSSKTDGKSEAPSKMASKTTSHPPAKDHEKDHSKIDREHEGTKPTKSGQVDGKVADSPTPHEDELVRESDQVGASASQASSQAADLPNTSPESLPHAHDSSAFSGAIAAKEAKQRKDSAAATTTDSVAEVEGTLSDEVEASPSQPKAGVGAQPASTPAETSTKKDLPFDGVRFRPPSGRRSITRSASLSQTNLVPQESQEDAGHSTAVFKQNAAVTTSESLASKSDTTVNSGPRPQRRVSTKLQDRLMAFQGGDSAGRQSAPSETMEDDSATKVPPSAAEPVTTDKVVEKELPAAEASEATNSSNSESTADEPTQQEHAAVRPSESSEADTDKVAQNKPMFDGVRFRPANGKMNSPRPVSIATTHLMAQEQASHSEHMYESSTDTNDGGTNVQSSSTRVVTFSSKTKAQESTVIRTSNNASEVSDGSKLKRRVSTRLRDKMKAFTGESPGPSLNAEDDADESSVSEPSKKPAREVKQVSFEPEQDTLSAIKEDETSSIVAPSNVKPSAAAKKFGGSVAERGRSVSMPASRKKSGWTPPQRKLCGTCGETVYAMELLEADGISYHKKCFKCTQCGKAVSLGTYAALEGKIYCKPHFKQLFKLKGNYNEGFGTEQHKHKWLRKQSEGNTV